MLTVGRCDTFWAIVPRSAVATFLGHLQLCRFFFLLFFVFGDKHFVFVWNATTFCCCYCINHQTTVVFMSCSVIVTHAWYIHMHVYMSTRYLNWQRMPLTWAEHVVECARHRLRNGKKTNLNTKVTKWPFNRGHFTQTEKNGLHFRPFFLFDVVGFRYLTTTEKPVYSFLYWTLLIVVNEIRSQLDLLHPRTS